MAHQAETRSAGRHRREQAGRHRAPRTLPLTAALSSEKVRAAALTAFSSERGRAVVLTAALGSALVTGVAGGTAAAAASSSASAPVALATDVPSSSPTPDAVTPVPGEEWKPPAAGTAAATPRKIKPKPKPQPQAVVVEKAALAWVNPNPSGRVTSCYGERWGRLHAGVDIAGPHGSPILAAGNGVVVRAGAAQGYGNAVLIDHGNGYLTHYGHLSKIDVQVGQRVEAGEQIGDEGSTGHSTGPHLHFEVHQGFYKNPIEPAAWLRERGVVLAC